MGLSASNEGAGQKEWLPAQSWITLGPHFAHFFVGGSAPIAQSSSFPVGCIALARASASARVARWQACAHKQMSRRYGDNVTGRMFVLNDNEQDTFKRSVIKICA
jgi:hypothetical protein